MGAPAGGAAACDLPALQRCPLGHPQGDAGMRTILVAVDSRATWSRALTVCEAIQRRKDLKLQLVLMGPASHEPRPASLVPDVEIRISRPTGWSMARLTGEYVETLGLNIEQDRPDIVISVTDRYESLAVAVAAALSNVHLAHIQGGEVSGGIDESMRHAITKLAHIHFPANVDSANRIERMGEDPAYIFNVGCPATDLLLRVDVGEPPAQPYILVSYNPVTTISDAGNYAHMMAILGACHPLIDRGYGLTVAAPNHDPGSDAVHHALNDTGTACEFSLPHTDFIRLMANAAVMVGNSSAGIREACYFGTPVVDVGIRQQARVCSANVLPVPEVTRKTVQTAIAFQLGGRYPPEQPFGNGGAGEKIAELLATMELPPIQKRIRY